jgi:hypothetical protein
MQLRIIFIVLALLLMVTGLYSFWQRRPSVDADNLPEPPARTVESGAGETPAGDSRMRLVEGTFHNVAHTGAGTATIYRTQDGSLVLQFNEFETAPANDLQVCLLPYEQSGTAAAGRRARALVVAPLKAIMGNQTYELPVNLEVAKYRAVTIVSRKSNRIFAMAPLARQSE